MQIMKVQISLIKKSIKKMFKLITFQLSKSEMTQFNNTDLIVGLFFTWVVGIGRYWDDPNAQMLQHLGLGSLAYVYILSVFIWIIIKPLKVENWTYFNVRTFVTLTSLPAILYAIPVEKFLYLDLASQVNAYFLLVVAVWRVALLIYYLKIFAGLNKFETFVTAFLPITFIVNLLSYLNLERAAFNIMGGMRQTAHDKAYVILLVLTGISLLAFLPLLISYVWIFMKKRRN